MNSIQLMKLVPIGLFFLMLSNKGLAQDPYLQEADEATEQLSKTIVAKYQPELVMTSDQLLRFDEKVVEFLIRKQTIDAATDLSVRRKIQLLKKLSRQETAEMANILTRPQLRQYKLLKKKFQPIYTVIQ